MRTFSLANIDLTVPLAGLVAGVSLLAFARTPSAASPDRGHPVPAVSRTGSISGVVTDGHGDAIPGARVSVLAEDGSLVSEATSGAGNEDLSLGEFHIDQLPRGMYSVKVYVPESKSTAGVPRVAVSAWEDTRVRIAVDVGY